MEDGVPEEMEAQRNGETYPDHGHDMPDKDENKFYGDAKDYWESVPATIDGMLGGFSRISTTDVNGSKSFLRPYIMGAKATVGKTRALDCGAGIGRITKRLLLTLFDTVDMVEQNQKFLEQSKKFMGADMERIGKCICCGLQDFTPESAKYDVIWCQWVLGHLTDDHLVDFIKRCHRGLRENGIICLKENVANGEERDFDEQDSSWTRPRKELEDLLEKTGLKMLKKQKQKGFPKALYDVYMYSLQ